MILPECQSLQVVKRDQAKFKYQLQRSLRWARAMTTPTGRASPDCTTSTPTAGISPGKVANLRSNYLQQMRDLHSLFESGAITESELQEQKVPILEQLKKFTPSLR